MIPALTIVRSLHARGLHIDVASHEDYPLAARSRYAGALLRYPDPLAQASPFVDWVADQIERGGYALIIPVTERSLTPLHHERGRIDERRVAMAPAAALAIALDKSRTLALAAALGIRVPRGCAADTPAAAVAFAATQGYPLVIKPTSSIGAQAQGRIQLQVAYARTDTELVARLAAARRYGTALIQEFFPGTGVGIELIAEHGRITFAFAHRRLHEVPLTGGASSLRLSVPIEPAMLDAARRLIAAMGWHGVAMVEFKQNPQTGEFCLMEVNGRFWGSLPLAAAAGADFPAMLAELYLDGAIRPRPAARTGIYCRNLPNDIHWLEAVLRRDAPPGLATLPTWTRVIRDLLLVFSPRHHFDTQQWRDPRPGLAELRRIVSDHWRRASGLIAHRRFLRRQRAAWRSAAVAARLRTGAHLLFLCYGNINRSALAEVLASERLAGRFRLSSAGLHPAGGRPADPVMVAVAAAHGHDLSASRSRVVDAALVADADLILAMEAAHIEQLAALFPASAGKAFLLGLAAAATIPDAEIPDPYGHRPDAYERCFAQVEQCITGLLGRSRQSPPGTADTTDLAL
jgi:protein-tyrosine-phosphatase/predicted ATP-grasp superfamily ATP-dependent carboligase